MTVLDILRADIGIYSADSRICQMEFTSENTVREVEIIEDLVFL